MFLVLGGLSLAWWGLLIYQALSFTPECWGDDAFCESGQTVAGDLISATFFAIFTLAPVWVIAGVIYAASTAQLHSRRAKLVGGFIIGAILLWVIFSLFGVILND